MYVFRYIRSAIEKSINIPFSNVKLGETNLNSLGPQGDLLKENLGKTVVVIGEEDSNPELVIRKSYNVKTILVSI